MVILRRFFGIIWLDFCGMVIRFGVESLSGLLLNAYSLSRGITIRFGGEYTIITPFIMLPLFSVLIRPLFNAGFIESMNLALVALTISLAEVVALN